MQPHGFPPQLLQQQQQMLLQQRFLALQPFSGGAPPTQQMTQQQQQQMQQVQQMYQVQQQLQQARAAHPSGMLLLDQSLLSRRNLPVLDPIMMAAAAAAVAGPKYPGRTPAESPPSRIPSIRSACPRNMVPPLPPVSRNYTVLSATWESSNAPARAAFKRATDNFLVSSDGRVLITPGPKRVGADPHCWSAVIGTESSSGRVIAAAPDAAGAAEGAAWLLRKLKLRDRRVLEGTKNCIQRYAVPTGCELAIYDIHRFLQAAFPHWLLVYDPDVAPTIACRRIRYEEEDDPPPSIETLEASLGTGGSGEWEMQPRTSPLEILVEWQLKVEIAAFRQAVADGSARDEPDTFCADDEDETSGDGQQVTPSLVPPLREDSNHALPVLEGGASPLAPNIPALINKSSTLYKHLSSWMRCTFIITPDGVVVNGAPNAEAAETAFIFIFPILRRFLFVRPDAAKAGAAAVQWNRTVARVNQQPIGVASSSSFMQN